MAWVTAPEGMSYINVWYALEKRAKPTGYMAGNSSAFEKAQQCTASCEKVDKLFQEFPLEYWPPFSMESESGRTLKVHFDHFPRLFVENYDALYGKGTAAGILQEYAKVPSEQRFDRGDKYQFSDLQESYKSRKNKCLDPEKLRQLLKQPRSYSSFFLIEAVTNIT